MLGLRIAAIVVLALCVLAAFGAVSLLDRVPAGARSTVIAALALGIVADGWAAPIPTARFDPLSNTDDRAAYAFLKASGPDGALIELPMGHADDPRELR